MLEKQIGAVTFSMSFDALSEMLLVSTSFVSGSERGSGLGLVKGEGRTSSFVAVVLCGLWVVLRGLAVEVVGHSAELLVEHLEMVCVFNFLTPTD